MKYGFVLPGGSAGEQLQQAVLAEESGWDGVFSYETAYGVDPWSLLAAVAQRTNRVRLGTLLTPLPWRRPWKLASQLVTLDHLSAGRAILAVGLGATDPGLGTTGEETDRRVRAELLDEGIDIIAGLHEGRLRFEGKHYQVNLEARDHEGSGTPVQRPHVPIWVVGVWPREKSMRRVLRCDGLVPATMRGPGEVTPDDIREMIAWLRERGGAGEGFDVIMDGETPAGEPDSAAMQVSAWADAGCTWWLETRWMLSKEERRSGVEARLRAGPPRLG
jgi:alkanesulfonate monooxygenase SsuD/methylene tetrahydromethanopterin reductase-like flavin-dependent oxidoreductase (luciferase family)